MFQERICYEMMVFQLDITLRKNPEIPQNSMFSFILWEGCVTHYFFRPNFVLTGSPLPGMQSSGGSWPRRHSTACRWVWLSLLSSPGGLGFPLRRTSSAPSWGLSHLGPQIRHALLHPAGPSLQNPRYMQKYNCRFLKTFLLFKWCLKISLNKQYLSKF